MSSAGEPHLANGFCVRCCTSLAFFRSSKAPMNSKKKKKSVPDITTLESYAAAAKKTTHSLPNAGISHSGKAPELVCHSVVNMYKNILCTPACKSTALGGKNQMFIIRRTDPQNTAQIQARIFNIFAKERT